MWLFVRKDRVILHSVAVVQHVYLAHFSVLVEERMNAKMRITELFTVKRVKHLTSNKKYIVNSGGK